MVAVDSSEQMVEHARETLGDRALVMHSDLTELELDEQVDAVFSNAVFHWVRDQDRLFERMYAALRPGGKLVAGCGAPGNLERFLGLVAEVSREAPYSEYLAAFEPGWRFHGAEETEARLRAVGFTDATVEIDAVEELPEDPAGYAMAGTERGASGQPAA